jgi:hypothetical protein
MIQAAVPATLARGEKLDLNGTLGHFELVHHQLKQVPSTLARCVCSVLMPHMRRPRAPAPAHGVIWHAELLLPCAAAQRLGNCADAGPRARLPKALGRNGQVSCYVVGRFTLLAAHQPGAAVACNMRTST